MAALHEFAVEVRDVFTLGAGAFFATEAGPAGVLVRSLVEGIAAWAAHG